MDVSQSKIHESHDDPDTLKSFIEFRQSEDDSCDGEQSNEFLGRGETVNSVVRPRGETINLVASVVRQNHGCE